MSLSRRQSFNSFSIILIGIGFISAISPYFTGGVYDLNHPLISALAVLFGAMILYQNGPVVSYKLLMVLVTAVLSFYVLALSGGVAFGFPYYIKWLIFFESLLLYTIFFANIGIVEEKTFTLLFFCTICQVAVFGYASLDPQYQITMSSGIYLELAFGNKNAAAMHLLILSALLILFTRRYRKQNAKRRAICALAFLVIAVILIYRTGSRSSFIPIIVILPFALTKKLDKFINSKTILIAVMFPLIFAIVYMAIYMAGYEDLTFLGRRLFNGRQFLWQDLFEGFPEKWVFGMFWDLIRQNGSVDFQLHNGWVDMIASYGVIVTGIFMWLIYNAMCKMVSMDKENILVVVCLLGIILQSTGEAATIAGSRAAYICTLLLFCERKQVSVSGARWRSLRRSES